MAFEKEKTEILLAINSQPGVHMKDLREQLVKKGEMSSLMLFRLRNELRDEGAIKMSRDGYGHHLTHEGEILAQLRKAPESVPEPRTRKTLTLAAKV